MILHRSQTVRFFLLGAGILLLLIAASGCRFPGWLQQPWAPPGKTADSHPINRIYIQSFTGQNLQQVQKAFFQAVKEQSAIEFMELLPDQLEQLGVLRIEVIDHHAWEIDELLTVDGVAPTTPGQATETIKRRNAIVSFRVSLYDAESGRLRIQKGFSQPFQQIYLDAAAIESRPDIELELHRLTKLLTFRIIETFRQNGVPETKPDFEPGIGTNWFSRHVVNLGYPRIKKGIRLAMAGDLDEAVWMWRIVLYHPEEDEDPDIYRQNRASAYYNIGLVYQEKALWWEAAEIFSRANRLSQRLKYAQSWGNSLQQWLDQQKDPPVPKEKIAVVKKVEKTLELTEDQPEISIWDMESNRQLLLKPRILWPLEPYLRLAPTDD